MNKFWQNAPNNSHKQCNFRISNIKMKGKKIKVELSAQFFLHRMMMQNNRPTLNALCSRISAIIVCRNDAQEFHT